MWSFNFIFLKTKDLEQLFNMLIDYLDIFFCEVPA